MTEASRTLSHELEQQHRAAKARREKADQKRKQRERKDNGHAETEPLSPHVREREDVSTYRDTEAFPDPEWPEPLGLDALTGVAGEFVALLMPHTEADPAALLFQFLTVFGSVVGSGPYYLVESDEHRARLNTVLVGASAKGRKGTSFGRVRTLFRLVDQTWEQSRVAGGLSTGEGLIFQVRDERTGTNEKGEDYCIDKGVQDKRFLAISNEFAGVLRVMARVGNSLSSIIRDAWDRDALRTLTKAEPMTATGAHISQIGHVTADELRRYLDATEAANGFANRFLFVCVKRARLLPDGGKDIDWTRLADRLKEIVASARSVGRLHMDNEAQALWHRIYGDLSDARPGLLGAVVARAEAQVIRLALIYALLDQSAHVGVPHLRAALECWRYAEQSARFVFGDALGDPIADSILAALRQAPDGLTRTQLSDVFGRNVDARQLSRGLQVLQRAGLASPTERPNGRATRDGVVCGEATQGIGLRNKQITRRKGPKPCTTGVFS
jgi:hypothetical protein